MRGDADDEPIRALVSDYVADYYRFQPFRGVWDGRHEHDGLAGDYSPAAFQRRARLLELYGERLRAIGAASANTAHGTTSGTPPTIPSGTTPGLTPPLATQAARDLALVEYMRRQELFAIRDWRPQTYMPGYYFGMLDLTVYIKRPFAPARERLERLTQHLRGIPDLLAGARTTLREPCARLALEQWMRMYGEIADYYEGDFARTARALAPDPMLVAAFEPALAGAVRAVREFAVYLRERLDERTYRDLAFGDDLFQLILRHLELEEESLEQLRRLADTELAALRARAEEVAGGMGLTLDQAFTALGRKRLAAGDVVATARQRIGELRAFLAQAGVVDLVGEPAYDVDVTPSFLSGASAFIESPGLFEPAGSRAMIYITLPSPGLSQRQRQEWMRKLNPWGLLNTIAHETFPGHLLHFQHLARNPSQAARAFTSFANIEGWAHYAEWMLLEQGFAGGNPYAELAYLSMALLRVSRMLVALNLHQSLMTLREAVAYARRITNLPAVRVRPDVMRTAQDPRVMGYTLGRLRVLRLRDDFRRQEGAAYSLRRFHDALLACGAPPFALARRMLLREPGPDPLSS